LAEVKASRVARLGEKTPIGRLLAVVGVFGDQKFGELFATFGVTFFTHWLPLGYI